MHPMDLVAIGLWIAAIAVMLWLAWEPWRQTRSMLSVDLSDASVGRPVSPFYVFVIPAAVAAGPFLAQIVGHEGHPNVWRTPHLLLPFAVVQLAVFVAAQFLLRGNILAAARRRRAAKAAMLDTFSAGRRSARRPR